MAYGGVKQGVVFFAPPDICPVPPPGEMRRRPAVGCPPPRLPSSIKRSSRAHRDPSQPELCGKFTLLTPLAKLGSNTRYTAVVTTLRGP